MDCHVDMTVQAHAFMYNLKSAIVHSIAANTVERKSSIFSNTWRTQRTILMTSPTNGNQFAFDLVFDGQSPLCLLEITHESIFHLMFQPLVTIACLRFSMLKGCDALATLRDIR